MIRTLDKINDLLSVRIILAAFWTSFWLLNGFDEFFNYEFFFGVQRDEQFSEYFASLALPTELALPITYAFGAAEVLLGLSFLYVLIGSSTYAIINRVGLLYMLLGRGAYSTINRLNFKGSILLFFLFSIGDILSGERGELVEHATFLVLVIVSFEFFLSPERSV